MIEFVKNFISSLTPEQFIVFKCVGSSVGLVAIYVFIKFIEKISLGEDE